MEYHRYRQLSECALGRKRASLVLRNARVVDVFSGEIRLATIAIEGGVIVGVGDYAGMREIDLEGRHVCPGFIDAHLHLESTLASPRQLVHAAMRHGTTTFIADPHEVANVAGEAGIDYILDQTEHVPANVFIMLPSCVPVNGHEENGCDFGADRMRPYLSHPRVLGLGEVMDYASVIEGEGAMLEKLALFEGRIVDGHAPALTQKQLAAYALAGIRTDHECTSYEYAMEQIRDGMYVLIREGSGAKNLEAIVSGIVKNRTDTSRFAFCTDDKHISDIEAEGHISYNVRRSIELGLSPIQAIRMATIHPAGCYRLDGLGAIAPGYRADMIVLDDLQRVAIHSVYAGGELVPEAAKGPPIPCPPALLHSVHMPDVGEADIALPAASGVSDVIEIVEQQITTRHLREAAPASGGLFAPNGDYNKAVVIERHRATGHIGVAPVKGFGINNGAIASTVSHDSHNMVVIGDNDESILVAIRALKAMQGGYVLVRGEQVVGSLPLPILGLMSEADNGEVERALNGMTRRAHEMGVPERVNPFATLSFLSLPVIPSLRLTTRGLYDVDQQTFL